MTPAHYKISFDSIEKVLKEFGLFRMNGIKNLIDDGVSDEFKRASIKDKYFNAYKIGLENYDFDFLLKDQSFFQFECYFNDFLEIRYSFFQNPIEFISYNDYLLNEIGNGDINQVIDETGSLFEQEYDQFLNEQELISNYATFRYDIDYNNYRPLIHSVSHLHIGHLNNIRIPLNKIITPLKFVLFTIKHVYYDQWKEKVEGSEGLLKTILEGSNSGESLLKENIWNPLEQLEIYMK